MCMFSVIHWNKIYEDKNKLFLGKQFHVPGVRWCDIAKMCLIREAQQHSIKMVFFFTPHPRTALWVYLEEVTLTPPNVYTVTGTAQVAVAWAHVLLFSQHLCVHVSESLSVNGKSYISSPSRRSGSVSPSFARVGDIYAQNECLSERGNGRERDSGIVWSDLLCWRVLKLLMQSNSLFWIVLWMEYFSLLRTEFIILSLFYLHWQSLYNT